MMVVEEEDLHEKVEVYTQQLDHWEGHMAGRCAHP
jgi:hypothetical protein